MNFREDKVLLSGAMDGMVKCWYFSDQPPIKIKKPHRNNSHNNIHNSGGSGVGGGSGIKELSVTDHSSLFDNNTTHNHPPLKRMTGRRVIDSERGMTPLRQSAYTQRRRGGESDGDSESSDDEQQGGEGGGVGSGGGVNLRVPSPRDSAGGGGGVSPRKHHRSTSLTKHAVSSPLPQPVPAKLHKRRHKLRAFLTKSITQPAFARDDLSTPTTTPSPHSHKTSLSCERDAYEERDPIPLASTTTTTTSSTTTSTTTTTTTQQPSPPLQSSPEEDNPIHLSTSLIHMKKGSLMLPPLPRGNQGHPLDQRNAYSLGPTDNVKDAWKNL